MVEPQLASTLMPAAFIGHGSPMNALELNRYTHAWQAFGDAVPRPRAILCISAHWYINATAVTVMSRPVRSTTSTASRLSSSWPSTPLPGCPSWPRR